MAPSVLQSGGFLLAVIGAAALMAATATSKWSVRDRPVDEEVSLYRHKGLWQDCATTFSGFTQCGSLQGSSGRRTRFTDGGLDLAVIQLEVTIMTLKKPLKKEKSPLLDLVVLL